MGRNRTFDTEEAINTATKLFWHGYGQTSLNDLTGALGIKPASFYFAFGSKEALFRQVVERYTATRDESFLRAFEGHSVCSGVEDLLRAYVDVLTDPAHTPGCLLVNNTLSTIEEVRLREWVVEQRATFKHMLLDRLVAAKSHEGLPDTFDPKKIADFIVTIAGGLALQAKSGVSREELNTTIDVAMETISRSMQR